MGASVDRLRPDRYGLAYRVRCSCGYSSPPMSQEAATKDRTAHLRGCDSVTESWTPGQDSNWPHRQASRRG